MITPYLPCPANTGGRIRMYRLAQALAARAEVSLYACAGVREAARQYARPELGVYRRVRVRNSDLGAVLPVLSARRVRMACPRSLARDLERDHARAPYDLLVVEHSHAAATTLGLTEVPMLLDEHNVESEYQAAYARAESNSRASATARQVALSAQWERRAWSEATLVTCVSSADARVVSTHRAGPVRVVPNGTATSEIPFKPPSARSGRDVLFVGLMSHAPNAAAAIFLARDVMPRVWHDEPGARLVLCGRSPTREVLGLAGPRIVVTGTVESVQPYLASSRVYANALSEGAGSSLKVPEALAAGLPMISTALGVRGFGLLAGEHYAEASGAASFAREIVRAIRAGGQLDARATRGRALAEGFDWAPIGARFTALAEAVARGATARELPA